MTRFYCGNMRCEFWEHGYLRREPDEGNCTREDTQITKDGQCKNMNLIYTDPSRYLITEGKDMFTILVDERKVVKAPDDRRCIIGWTFAELTKLCKQRKATIERVG